MIKNQSVRIWYINCLILILLLSSCNYFTASNTDHPVVLKPALIHAEDLFQTKRTDALQYIESAYRTIDHPGPGDMYAKYNFYRKYYYEEKNYPQALLYIDSMLNVLKPHATEKAYNLEYAEAYLHKGDALFKQKRFSAAYLNYYEGKTSVLATDDTCAYSTFLYDFYARLAKICYGQSRFTDAIAWHKAGMPYLVACEMDFQKEYLLQGLLDNIALCYSKVGINDTAMYYYHKALETVKSIQPTTDREKNNLAMARGVILGNIGTINFRQGDIIQAERNFRESIAINSQKGYAYSDAQITKMKLAELYLYTKQFDSAGILIQQIKSPTDTIAEAQDRLQMLQLEASYKNAIGQTAQAYALLMQSIEQINALKNENQALMATDFTKEFELLKRQYDLQDLQRQNLQKNLYLLAAVLMCLMAVIIIYLVLKSSKQTKTIMRESQLHNKQLEMTLDALEKSSQENTQLLGVVAHDLRNPISAIYGISTLMAEDEGRNEEDLEMLELIKISSKNLDIIILDLLAAKVNKVSGDKAKVPVDLLHLLQESVSLLQYRAEEKKQRIVLVDGQHCRVSINRDRVWRVVNNLIVNAIKFSPGHTQINISIDVQEQEAIVCVKDEGIGIPAELKEKIFLLSTDAKRQGTDGEETFGLGLYISKQVIEEQGGRIWLESNVGKGTSFYFSLPLI